MKLNLPTTWTKEKITSLLLMTWLSTNGAKAGQGFKNCLTYADKFSLYESDFTSYDHLLEFPFANNNEINSGKKLSLCCSGSKCFVPEFICDDFKLSFDCMKIGQTIFCEGHGCGGIIGDKSISANTTIGPCKVDIGTMENLISSANSYPLNVNASGGYADYSYHDSGNYSDEIKCNWDNGGWTCYEPFSDIEKKYVNESCNLQWIASFPIIQSPSSSGSNELVKIIGPVVMGSVLVVSCLTGATCLHIVRRREKKHQLESQQFAEEFAIELRDMNEVSEQTIQEKLERKIKRELRGEIIKTNIFPTYFSPACAMVIEKKKGRIFGYHRLLFIIYKNEASEASKSFKMVEIPYIMRENAAIPSRSARKELLEAEADRIRIWLSNSYKPAVALHSLLFVLDRRGIIFDTYFLRPSFENTKLLIKEKINLDENPNGHIEKIKPLDVVKREIKGTGLHHFAIYLGKNEEGISEVVHISSYNVLIGQKKECEEKLSKMISQESPEAVELKKEINQLEQDLESLNPEERGTKVKITPWDYFLLKHNKAKEAKEVIYYHFLVPFKKPELVLEHIKKSLKADFGKGKYKLITRNCEHFAWLCTSSINFSEQYEKLAINNWGTSKVKNFRKLNEEIKKGNKKFDELEKSRELDEKESKTLENLQALIEVEAKQNLQSR